MIINKKGNTIFYITSYYRSIIAIASSVALIFYCIAGLKKNVEDYPKVTGKIVKAHLHWDKSPFTINIDNTPNQWYDIFPEKYYSNLSEKAVPGKTVEIWYNPKNNSIKKLVVEGEVLRPYVKSTGISVGFIIVGSLFLMFNVIYIVRNPSHARGDVEERSKGKRINHK